MNFETLNVAVAGGDNARLNDPTENGPLARQGDQSTASGS
jgi:hypothetical protein